MMGQRDLVEQLGETVGEKKAEDLVTQAMQEASVSGSRFDTETATTILETITERDEISSLTAVAANTTLTQVRNAS